MFQRDVFVLRPREYGLLPAQVPRDDHHVPAADADDRRLRGQHLGPQLLGHGAAALLPHQPLQHQTLHGYVLLLLRALRPILLQGLPSAEERRQKVQDGAGGASQGEWSEEGVR